MTVFPGLCPGCRGSVNACGGTHQRNLHEQPILLPNAITLPRYEDAKRGAETGCCHLAAMPSTSCTLRALLRWHATEPMSRFSMEANIRERPPDINLDQLHRASSLGAAAPDGVRPMSIAWLRPVRRLGAREQLMRSGTMAYRRRASFGSSVSRKPSPIRLMASTVVARHTPGKSTIQKAIRT
jgi:hypothetical protein